MLQCRSAETELIGTAGHVFAPGMGVEQGYMDSFQDLKCTSTLIFSMDRHTYLVKPKFHICPN